MKNGKSLENKYQKLKKLLLDIGSGVIAFSGGKDSGLLAKVAYEVLGKNIFAVTAYSPTYPSWENKDSSKIAREIGISHLIIHTEEFKDNKFIRNHTDRCYWCKRELFSKIRKIADKKGNKYILDGTNFDDKDDIRPGLKANKEFSVRSPLYECKFRSQDIQDLARRLGLSFWDKPSGTCLSSRIPFGQEISLGRIKKVGEAEMFLRGFFGPKVLFRARDHGDLLRIEVANWEWTKMRKSDITKIVRKLKEIGYKYVTLDLEGYIPAGKRQ
ncbi:MAG: ATP-dependent sacrificial sulfur transferase LarE [Candidatus Omnitrophota bacterium]|nr:MAG: ATP-dependent sacrificial sulfur transferase LarE [Candidatus Omnitrophota bacterium]